MLHIYMMHAEICQSNPVTQERRNQKHGSLGLVDFVFRYPGIQECFIIGRLWFQNLMMPHHDRSQNRKIALIMESMYAQRG